MTREEHISNLETIGCDGWTVTTDAYKSLQFAIQTLEQEPCEDAISREYLVEHIKACWTNGRPKYSPDLSELLSWIDDVPLVQPKMIECEDAISKQAVIDALENIGSLDTEADKEYAKSVFEELPSVTPQPKTGHWIRITNGAMKEKYICSECGRQIEDDGIEGLLPIKYPYCHCGAKM